MKEIKWYFPKHLEEVPSLLNKGVPHGGGTGILRMSMNRINGLIDLHELPLNYFKKERGIIRIGATQTYADVVKNMVTIDREHVLVKALRGAASESLRNRITVGGSIAGFRPWSDIMGPLLALDAKVSLLGKKKPSFTIIQIVESSDLIKKALIKEVSFKTNKWLSWYHRETRTTFDYAIFTITILLSKMAESIDDIRVVIVGTKKKFMRLFELEESIRNMPPQEVDVAGSIRMVRLDLPPKQGLSTDYMEQLVRAQLEKGLKEILRR